MAKTNPLLVEGTPLEDHLTSYGLLVKREDLSCPPPGPPFSKTRGVFAHVEARVREGVRLIGVLDTFHSQAGHAVAQACQHFGVRCLNFYPVYKGDEGKAVRPPQQAAEALGAELMGLKAGRSAILYHTARKLTLAAGGYLMPNALRLKETVSETAKEVVRTVYVHGGGLRSRPWLIPASSATIASGVAKGLLQCFPGDPPRLVIHMGYSRSETELRRYFQEQSGYPEGLVEVVDQGYAYKDQAKTGPTPPWPCNPFYDLKLFRWWQASGRDRLGEAVFWNVG